MAVGYRGAIFDVDGVLVDSPHERAWRETLQLLMETDWHGLQPRTTYTPERFTPAIYQEVVAGKPRLSGARAALDYFGVPDAERRAEEYAERKQQQVVELIGAGKFLAFPDALRFLLAVRGLGIRVAAASSSKNAGLFLKQIRLDEFAAEQGLHYDFLEFGLTLQSVFDADVTGRDFEQGKPHPMIFLTAAEELDVASQECFVVEDATSGVQAARAGNMAALGVARLDDEELLRRAGADLVVTTLDDVDLDALAEGRLEQRSR
jgi:beta-phosphoglucomutase